MAYCNYCGTYVEEQTLICPSCNAVLKSNLPNAAPVVDANGNIPLEQHPKKNLAIASMV